MTRTEKRQLRKALIEMRAALDEVAALLSQPQVSLDVVANCLQWAAGAYARLVSVVEDARNVDDIDLDTFTTLCWLKSDLGWACDVLRFCLTEQERAD